MQLAASKKKHVDTYIHGYVEAPNGAIANKRLLDGADKSDGSNRRSSNKQAEFKDGALSTDYTYSGPIAG